MAIGPILELRGAKLVVLAFWSGLFGCTYAHDIDGLTSGPESTTHDAGGEAGLDALADEGPADAPPCVPITCADITPRCGPIPDGCASTITCACVAPSTCGADGMCACPEVPVYAEAAPKRVQTDNDNYPGNPVSWDTPMGAAASGGDRATSTLPVNVNSMRLHATRFDFAVPPDATISGIELFLVKSADPQGSGSGTIDDYKIALLKAGNQQGDRTQDVDWPLVDKTFRYGSATDGWGTTWVPADVNDSESFGAVVRAHNGSASGNTVTARVDFIQIRVHYFPKCQALSVAN